MPTSPDEVQALIDLLDDPDGEVQAEVRRRLEELGRDVLPDLRTVRAQADAEVQARIDDVVHDLHMGDLTRAWHAVLGDNAVDLERGAFLLALYRYPTLDVQRYTARLDNWADRVRPDVEAVDGAEQALVLADFMTETLGFRGNTENYYDPSNSYLNRVMDRKLGIPISLSVIFLLLAQRLGLPVYGINMPVHFLTKYDGPSEDVYVDLFRDDNRISKEDCIRLLVRSGIRPMPAYFEVAEPKAILLRMVRNLLAIARETNQTQMAEELTALIAPYDESVER